MSNRVLPAQDIVAEQACLGACLIDESAFDEVSGVITSSEDFYDPANQEIYKSMLSLTEENKAIDILTVSDYLRKHGKLENCRGVLYLNTLADQGIVANAGSYAKIVVENAILRRLQQASYAISNIAQNEELNVGEKIDRSEEIVLSVGLSKNRGDLEPISKVIGDVFIRSYNRVFNGTIVSGLSSGFKELDEITSGFHPSNLIILGARPSMGKTAFALAVAVNVALNESKPGKVAIFSLEMSREDLCTRMICSLAKINNQHLLKGETAEEKNAILEAAVGKLRDAPIFIDDQGGTTILEMKAKLRRLKKREGVDLVIIDYLQLIKGTGRHENRVQEITDISRQLKTLAKEFRVPIIALSQLSRNLESRQDKRPMLSDLRESGAIEQDADLVTFLYRDEYYNKQSSEKNIAEIIIAKHRNGPIGSLKLEFIKEFGCFRSLESEREFKYSDIPLPEGPD